MPKTRKQNKFLNIRDSYQNYINSNDTFYGINFFLKINYLFIKFILKKILEDKEIIPFPLRMGTLMVKGRKSVPKIDEEGKITGLPTDWNKTMALWKRDENAKAINKRIYHTNEHTGGIRYKFFWEKRKSKSTVRNKASYYLRISKINSRMLSDKIFNGEEFIRL